MNSTEIVKAATERYNAKFQELKGKEEELNRSVHKLEKFWRQTLKDNISRFRKYADDIGRVAKENEYTLEGEIYFSPIKVEQYIDERRDISAEMQKNIEKNLSDFGINISKALSSSGPKGEKVVEAAAGAAVGLAVTFLVGTAVSIWEEQKALKKAKEKEDEIEVAIAKMNETLSLYDGYIYKANDAWSRVRKIAETTKKYLDDLEPLAPDFRNDEDYYQDIWEASLICKGELEKLSKIPLINEKGNIDPELISISDKISTVTIRR